MEKREFDQLFYDAVEENPDRNKIYKMVTQTFNISTALYPGCGLDITPSLYIPQVTYLDQAAHSAQFFEQKKWLLKKIFEAKEYPSQCCIEFICSNYNTPPQLPQYDLLISQYAGNVGQVMKQFLKPGGLLLVADGPSDYQLALQDQDYQFLGTIRYSGDKVCLVPELLPPEKYQLPNGIKISLSRNFCFRKLAT